MMLVVVAKRVIITGMTAVSKADSAKATLVNSVPLHIVVFMASESVPRSAILELDGSFLEIPYFSAASSWRVVAEP